MEEHMLTTVDNPYDPFTHWEEWNAFDVSSGYNSNALLARVLISSEELPESLQEQAIEDAIDEIIEHNVLGIYRKVSRTSSSP